MNYNLTKIYLITLAFTYLLLPIEKLELDNRYSEYVISKTNLWESINPNLISIIGMIINFYIFYLIYNQKIMNKNPIFILILLFIRWSADILDGGVAKKYNKCSKIGHLLDTTSDTMFSFILVYVLLSNFLNIKIIIAIFILFVTILEFKVPFINDINHNNLKNIDNNRNKSSYRKLIGFYTNNTYVMFILLYLLIYKL